jgi:hypothetical protein
MTARTGILNRVLPALIRASLETRVREWLIMAQIGHVATQQMGAIRAIQAARRPSVPEMGSTRQTGKGPAPPN